VTTGHPPVGSTRPSPRGWVRRALVLLLAAAVAASIAYRLTGDQPGTSARYLGVYEPGTPSSYQPVTQFTAATGERPNLVLCYSRWGSGFPGKFASEARAHGAELIVQIQPTGISLAKIASGQYNGYLHSYAEQLRAFGNPVVIGFAHEMNGNWYSWGAGHVPAATWVAAWRRVVTTIRAAGATKVTWMWTISHAGTAPVRRYWPGASYVTWVGIDGYFVKPSDTYGSVFGSAVDEVRSFTDKPILLSEVGVGPGTGKKPQDVAVVFGGIAQQHLLGSVWFDVDQHGGGLRQDWRLEGDRAVIAAFRKAAAGMNLAR
jgi:mannan endo-1,4-beta-mannosidase